MKTKSSTSSFLYRTSAVMIIVMLALAAMPVTSARAAACTFTATGTGALNWSSLTWSAVGTDCSTYPGQTFAGDIVVFANNQQITLDVDLGESLASITFPTLNANATTLNISGRSVNVTGTITIPRTSAGVGNALAAGTGTLNAGSIAFTNSGSTNRHDLTISTGTVTVSGDITLDGSNDPSPRVIFTGAGTLNVGGTLWSPGSGTLTTFAGSTVNYNGAGPQTVRVFTYSNLILSGSDLKSMATGISTTGNLSIAPTGTAKASVANGADLTVNSLTVGGLGTANDGKWGSTASVATYKTDTYFNVATTGMLTVTTDTRSSQATLTVVDPSPVTYGSTPTLTTSGGSGTGAITFDDGASTGCSVTGSTLTVIDISLPCAVTATKAADSNYTSATSSAVTVTLAAKGLTITGVSANDKVYDGATDDNGFTGGTLNGVVGSDDVSLDSSGATGTFASASVGNNISVTASGFGLSGTAAGNYSLTQPTGLTADITTKALTISGVSANNKDYDGNTNDNGFTGGTLNGVVGSDDVSLDSSGATGTFASANAGNGIAVTASGFGLSGTAAGNYSLTQPTGLTANITAKALTITGLTADNKVYDGNTTATLSGTAALSGIVGSDDVTLSGSPSASFANANVANGKSVTVSGYTLGGTAAGNYSLTQPTGLTANITAKALTVSGVSANNKGYDGTTDDNGFSGGTLNGVIGLDNVSLDSSVANGTFASPNVGNGIAVTASGFSLSGTAAGNYSLTQPTGLTANITAKTLTVTANNQTIISGNPDPAFTFGYSGFVNSETSAVIDTQPTCTVTGAHSAPGSYPIVCSGGADNNYSFAYVNGSLTVNAANNPPTDIALSNSSINENQTVGTLVGTLSTSDPDLGDTFTYSFCGGTDDASFSISGNSLLSAASFDFETKNSYSICIRTTDSGALTTTKTFSIAINNLVDTQTFGDVTTNYWAWNFIERLYAAGITTGCTTSPLNYCPTSPVTRAQMAVFLLKGIHGSSYTPPAVGNDTGFTDVATDYWAAAWIKQLAAEGITGGCGAGIYCPENTVTRAQMAVFLLKATHGASYSPPAATGVFTDVATDYWAAAWIEQLAAEGITSGCAAGTYCPENAVTRDQMAVFLVKAFNLP